MKHLAEDIINAKQTIIFTGAGMSTESGLPDFRSKSRGLWEKFNPDELANIQALQYNQEEFTEFYRYRLSEITKYKAHQGHIILAEWEKRGLIEGIITQNVDGFHHDAGSKNVLELHGTFRKFYCHACKKEKAREQYLANDTRCDDCGGIIRPGIVLFGETLPMDVFTQAEIATEQADLFIVLGSSLSVTPANMFPTLAKQTGAKLVIINREPTELDDYADRCIHHLNIKAALTEVEQHLKEMNK